ncbi:MAG: 3-hydroxyacyl-CoA dehydrogenase NAD-binding domain-containing protein [Candidatus Thorarchaeota archaeon]
MNKVTVIGAGFMGNQIAHISLLADYREVILTDINQISLENALRNISNGLNWYEKNGFMKNYKSIDYFMDKLTLELNLEKAVENSDIVIEAVPEKIKVKKEIYNNLSLYAPKNTIFATNTSTMSITRIGSFYRYPENLIGIHFIPPVIERRLVEICPGEYTSEKTIRQAIKFAESLPCITGDRFIVQPNRESPGFILNRLLIALNLYFNWLAEQALKKRISWQELDNDFSDSEEIWGFCELIDYIGVDVWHDVSKSFEMSLSSEFKPPLFLKDFIKNKKLGVKTGEGFFKWPKGKRTFLEWTREERPIKNKAKKAGLINLEAVFALLFNEGCKLLEEKVVNDFETIDNAITIGTNYQLPALYPEGKIKYKEWSEILEKLVKDTGFNYFKPCNLMKRGNFKPPR